MCKEMHNSAIFYISTNKNSHGIKYDFCYVPDFFIKIVMLVIVRVFFTIVN